jgi:hypothetical protein
VGLAIAACHLISGSRVSFTSERETEVHLRAVFGGGRQRRQAEKSPGTYLGLKKANQCDRGGVFRDWGETGSTLSPALFPFLLL